MMNENPGASILRFPQKEGAPASDASIETDKHGVFLRCRVLDSSLRQFVIENLFIGYAKNKEEAREVALAALKMEHDTSIAAKLREWNKHEALATMLTGDFTAEEECAKTDMEQQIERTPYFVVTVPQKPVDMRPEFASDIATLRRRVEETYHMAAMVCRDLWRQLPKENAPQEPAGDIVARFPLEGDESSRVSIYLQKGALDTAGALQFALHDGDQYTLLTVPEIFKEDIVRMLPLLNASGDYIGRTKQALSAPVLGQAS